MLLLTNVRKSYQEPDGAALPVLDIESFQMAAGEQVVLLGQSGGGKTTLLHIIAGITTADEGMVEIDGLDITRLGEAGRDRFRAEKLGYIFQTFNLLPGFTALENVLLGMSFTRQASDTARAKQLLEQVGLGHRLTHKPGQLSVGERQRVSVARASATKPKLILADEPTANVDARHQQQIIDQIRQRCEAENIALLMVTHSPEVSGQFDRVVQLEEVNRVVAVV